MNSIDTLPGIEHAAVIPRGEHGISRKDISEAALRVIHGLQKAGFAAFLVGGCVRDLLLGLHPKDFDVATDAHPEDVRRIFRRSRIVGRRFKIVHVRFGREVIEVTTFRGHHEASNRFRDAPSREQSRELDSAHSHAGMTLIDNVYGDIDEDAGRRDFTANALYYSTDGFVVLDFHDGLRDLRERRLRIIGDAGERYREDPVRMLRAIRFAAKLEFSMDSETEAPIRELFHLLESASSPRLFDELLKLLCGGHAAETFRMLRDYGIDRALFSHGFVDGDEAMDPRRPARRGSPCATATTGLPGGSASLRAFCSRPCSGRRCNGCSVGWKAAPISCNCANAPSRSCSNNRNIRRFRAGSATSARKSGNCKSALSARTARSVNFCFEHPRFRAGYDFLLLRESSGEDCGDMGEWWTTFQDVDEGQRVHMLEQFSARPKRPPPQAWGTSCEPRLKTFTMRRPREHRGNNCEYTSKGRRRHLDQLEQDEARRREIRLSGGL